MEDSGSGIEDSGSGMEDSGSWKENSGSGMEDSGSGMEDSGSGMEDSGSGMVDRGSGLGWADARVNWRFALDLQGHKPTHKAQQRAFLRGVGWSSTCAASQRGFSVQSFVPCFCWSNYPEEDRAFSACLFNIVLKSKCCSTI